MCGWQMVAITNHKSNNATMQRKGYILCMYYIYIPLSLSLLHHSNELYAGPLTHLPVALCFSFPNTMATMARWIH